MRNDSPVTEHFTETRLLVRPDDGGWLQVNVQVGIDSVVAEIILFQHRVFEFVTPLFDVLRWNVNLSADAGSVGRPTSIFASSISKA